MRDSIKKAIGETVQDMLNSGIKSSFTKKELDSLGIKIPEIQLTTYQIKAIREQMKLSHEMCEMCEMWDVVKAPVKIGME